MHTLSSEDMGDLNELLLHESEVLKLPPVVWHDFTVQRCVASVCDCVWK